MLQERLKERLWDLFAPDPYYSTLCISVQSFISAYKHTFLLCLFFFHLSSHQVLSVCSLLFLAPLCHNPFVSIYLICKALLCSLP